MEWSSSPTAPTNRCSMWSSRLRSGSGPGFDLAKQRRKPANEFISRRPVGLIFFIVRRGSRIGQGPVHVPLFAGQDRTLLLATQRDNYIDFIHLDLKERVDALFVVLTATGTTSLLALIRRLDSNASPPPPPLNSTAALPTSRPVEESRVRMSKAWLG